MFSTADSLASGTEMAYPLFSQISTIGTRWMPAKFSDSWKSPLDAAPSPKYATATASEPAIRAASAMPAAWGMWVAIGDDPVMMFRARLPQWLGIWRPPELGSDARAKTPN